MITSTVRTAAAVSALAALLLLPEAQALRPAAPDSAPAGVGMRSPILTSLATPDLIQEMAGQRLKGLGLSGDDAARLAERAMGLATLPDGARELDALAEDAAALGAVDALSARDVLARVELLLGQPVVTTDGVGRAFGVASDPMEREAYAAGAPSSSVVFEPPAGNDRDTMAGGTCLTCPNFDFGPFTITTAWQIHAGTTGPGSSDCNWYSFDVDSGATYEFATCAPGSATFDTVLDLFNSTCGFLSSNDGACGLQSRIQWTSGFTGSVRLKVRGFGGAVGPYELAYRRVCIGEPDCASPDLVLPAPNTTCQYQPGTVSGCTGARYYRVALNATETYTFTLCGATCSSAYAGFDSQLQLFDAGGALVSSDSSACGDDGQIVHTVGAAASGNYCIVVLREAGAANDFNLGYSVACMAPSGVTVTPLNASTSEPDCTRNQPFNVTTAGTGPFTWNWTITPTAGQSATPPSGTATTSGTSLSFSSMLQGSGDYTVSVTATNDCGADGATITFNLEDRAGPLLTPTAEHVSCGSTILPMAAPPSPATTPRHAAEQLSAMSEDELTSLLSEPDPLAVRDALAEKLRVAPKSLVVLDATVPGVVSAPGTMSVSCGSPCTGFGTLEADTLYYDVFLSCDDGSFTARTGVVHPVTVSSGSPQNVIFGGAGGGPGTSDASWYVHETADHYINPSGGMACLFNPADTSSEPGNVGIEAEWTRVPSGLPGVHLTLREEIVAFGNTEANSGVRLTLGATNEPISSQPVTMGVRWQIDYQNAFDDGPLFAEVVCSPFEVRNERSTEHEFSDAEIATFDFYRIQNNTSTPIFGNFTNTAELGGWSDTGKPDRLTYARWGSVVGTGWNYSANEGDPNPDFDSAVLYWFGYDVADGITIAPGETFTRSVIIFTAGDDQDCGDRRPGSCEAEASVQICPGECARVGATATDGCSSAVTVELLGTSPGAPPCTTNPCVLDFPDEGDFVYTWRATDAAGNQVECTSTVVVREGPDCNVPPSCNAGGPATSECREAPVTGASVDDFDGDEITYTWTTDNPMVSVDPPAGLIGAGFGPRSLPPTVARLDSSVDPCGVTANLTLHVDDGQGGTSSCTTTVLFLDVTPPVVSSTSGGGGPDGVCLWPPNHWYVPVTASDLGVLVSDGCTNVTYQIVGCVSDQPDDAPERPDIDFWNGDGNTSDDCVISPDGLSIWVRSERCGGGATAQDGRHYGIAVVAVDACGNASLPTVVGAIHVPHDQAPAEDGCLNPTEIGFQ